MKRWQDFLDSLSTKGGNVFMLFTCLCFLYMVLIHVVHDQKDSMLVSVVHDMVVGFGGALLGGLSGSSSKQQMADRVETALSGQAQPQVIISTEQPNGDKPVKP